VEAFMKKNRHLIIGVVLIVAGVLGLTLVHQFSMRGFPGGMGMGMMGRMMMDSGMMRARGMMGDMMNNMEKMDRKTEFSSNGERIFYTGINSRGEVIKNSHGMQGVGCAMCHGADSQGMRMMMMDIPPLTWGYLTSPEGHTHPGGRSHPPYTEPSFNVCVLAGIDPAGNGLNAMMPRWAMESDDLDDLTKYLKAK
jgi:hypothetical protein